MDQHPLYRFEHINQQWVSEQQWTYSVSFDMPTKYLNLTELHLSYVGSIAEVFLNEVSVGKANNLYRNYYLQIPDGLLKEYKNTLNIVLESTV